MKAISKLAKRIAAVLFALILCVITSIPLSAFAAEPEKKVVRVGWYESSYCYFDKYGRRRGIAYEYQQKVAAHTGWKYEYVEDSWPNLLQMLMDGKIDLLSDVSYTEERAGEMLYPSLPMGAESYYIYINADSTKIDSNDMKSLNGKKVGVNKDSLQVDLLRDWERKNDISLQIVELALDEDESFELLEKGGIDAYVTLDSIGSTSKVVPVWKIGSSDYYFAVNKDRPDLVSELNSALAAIQDEDPYFNQRMFDQYVSLQLTNTFLSPTQEKWLSKHGKIRVGYRKDYLPFCAEDKSTGELTGALNNFLNSASKSLDNANIEFEAVPYATTSEALEAMRKNEVDCVFPVDLSSDYCEKNGFLTLNPIMQTEMNILATEIEGSENLQGRDLKVAINEGNTNFDTFVMDHMPEWEIVDYKDDEDCFQAVAANEADGVLVCDYRMYALEPLIKRYKLVTLPTSETMGLSFALRDDEQVLYSIMNKLTNLSSDKDMEYALASYISAERKVSFADFLRDNQLGVIIAIVIIFGLIISLMSHRLRDAKKLNDQQKEIEEALRRELDHKEKLESVTKIVRTDPLTGVKSRHAFNEAEAAINQRIAEGETLDLGIVVFDLNNLKTINDMRGHEIGDEYIKEACGMICDCFKHSPVYRVGGDEFIAILEGEDYRNQKRLLESFEAKVLENSKHDRAVVAFGCSRFDPHKDKRLLTVIERADAAMYDEKTILKKRDASTGALNVKELGYGAEFEDISAINMRKTILVTDDVANNREMLGDILGEDYNILYASDGNKALEILRENKGDIALMILDLVMPNMTGQEVLKEMQVDDDLMAIPVIVLTVDQDAELECLRYGAMDFIPKPFPDIDIVKARISKCIELSETRDIIKHTQRDKLTGLFNIDYFLRYVKRYDQYYEGESFDAVICDVNEFYEVNEKYGREFGDLILRSIGIGIKSLARRTGGIACRKGGDTFMLYCPHREDYKELLDKFLKDLFVDKKNADKVTLKFGMFADAQQEPDIEERFVRAQMAADSIEHDPDKLYIFYEFENN